MKNSKKMHRKTRPETVLRTHYLYCTYGFCDPGWVHTPRRYYDIICSWLPGCTKSTHFLILINVSLRIYRTWNSFRHRKRSMKSHPLLLTHFKIAVYECDPDQLVQRFRCLNKPIGIRDRNLIPLPRRGFANVVDHI